MISIHSLVSTHLCTRIETPTGTVGMVEHLLAALYGAGIDDVDIEVEGGEVPILDGSALPWVTALKPRVHSDEPVIPNQISRVIHLGTETTWVRAEPSDDCILRVDVDFVPIGPQSFEAPMDEWLSAAAARTFGFHKDWPVLKAKGFAQGASLDTVLVYDGVTILNPEGPRFQNEVARHKWLDLLGDLSLLGTPFKGKVHAYCAGHTLHTQLVKAILSENEFDFPAVESTLMNSPME